MRKIVMRGAVEKESVRDESVKDERLSKWLSQMGVCSRRETDRLIQEGKALVDGCPTVMRQKASPGQTVIYNGIPVPWEISGRPEPILLAVGRPRRIVCTTSPKDGVEDIVEYLKYPERIYPMRRLDKESEDLLLMTNQRDLVNKTMRDDNAHKKEYIVTVDHAMTAEFMDQVAKGVYLKELDVGIRPCRLHKVGEETFSIVLTQRFNGQVCRMHKAYEYHVKQLVRVRIMDFCLGNLKTGEGRRVTPEECRELTRLLKDSTSLPARHGRR